MNDLQLTLEKLLGQAKPMPDGSVQITMTGEEWDSYVATLQDIRDTPWGAQSITKLLDAMGYEAASYADQYLMELTVECIFEAIDHKAPLPYSNEEEVIAYAVKYFSKLKELDR